MYAKIIMLLVIYATAFNSFNSNNCFKNAQGLNASPFHTKYAFKNAVVP